MTYGPVVVEPPVQYVVQRNGFLPDRPAYPFANGVRSKTAAGRAPILTDGQPTPCDASVGVVEGTSRYFKFSANPGLVALCTVK